MIRDQIESKFSTIEFQSEDADRVVELVTQLILDTTEQTVKNVRSRDASLGGLAQPEPHSDATTDGPEDVPVKARKKPSSPPKKTARPSTAKRRVAKSETKSQDIKQKKGV